MDKLMRNDRRWFVLPTVIMIGMVLCGLVHAADVQKKLINFQGYLTDNANPPNPLDGTYNLTFRIYERPGDLNHKWMEQHQGVTVIRGNVSVLLGSTSEMNLVFDEPRYLGIQVGTDPEMTPRQKLLPAFHATSANKLVVTNNDQSRSELGVNNIVPIGGIIAYYGDPASLPSNWMVCDGTWVTDEESPFYNRAVPDLKAKFIRGEANGTYNILDAIHGGGLDSHTHTVPAHSHTISIQNAGEHSHGGVTHNGGVDHTHVVSHQWTSYNVERRKCYEVGDHYCADDDHTHSFTCTSHGASAYLHAHGISPDGTHSHGASSGNTALTSDSTSHLPSYVALHYIIRIK